METEKIFAEATALDEKGAERRRSRRFPCKGVAEGLAHEPEILFRGEVRDMSLTGCLILTRAYLRIRPFTEVELSFLVNNNSYRTVARVVDIRRGEGVGLEFLHADVKTSTSFSGLLLTLQRMAPPETESGSAQAQPA